MFTVTGCSVPLSWMARPPLRTKDNGAAQRAGTDVHSNAASTPRPPAMARTCAAARSRPSSSRSASTVRSEEHTSELQSHVNLVCRLLLEKKKNTDIGRVDKYSELCKDSIADHVC